ncbi:MAG: hypothetical protein GKR90_27375 [Pseudomonadales bacterium]|nr:hypothetical protein [Pseudomonadales bacterium]
MGVTELEEAIQVLKSSGINSFEQAELFLSIAREPGRSMQEISGNAAGTKEYGLVHNRLRSLEMGRRRSLANGPGLVRFETRGSLYKVIKLSRKGMACIRKLKRI